MSVSLAFTDNAMSRAIEPWAASPDRRFKVIETMAKAGVPVGVMLAPIIPGVNDSQMVGLLERAANAGATRAGWVLLRLPGVVKQVFEERTRAALPLAADKILHRIRNTRGGEKLYDATFHTRGRGEGPYADMLATMFDTTVARLGLTGRRCNKTMLGQVGPDDAPTTFRRPPEADTAAVAVLTEGRPATSTPMWTRERATSSDLSCREHESNHRIREVFGHAI
ncbi:MAG: radical SAM protein [Deltaproteobacteria bacterium]|nr:radical SAM protein [Deltaproteobacteria bacterium]